MIKVFWEIDGALCGIGQGNAGFVREQYCQAPPWNVVAVCPKCGKLWARVSLSIEDYPDKEWKVLTIVCKHCGGTSLYTPGTLLDGWIDEWFGAGVPAEVLRREFLLESVGL